MYSILFVWPETELLPSKVEPIPPEVGFILPEAAVHGEHESSLRKSFLVKEKCEYVLAVDAQVARGVSHHLVCSMMGLPHNSYA